MWSNVEFSSDCTNSGLSDEQCLRYAKMYCPQSCNQCNDSNDCTDVQTSSWCGQLKSLCQCTCSSGDGPYTTAKPGNLKILKFCSNSIFKRNTYKWYYTSFSFHPILECIDTRPAIQCENYADIYCRQSCHRCNITGGTRK